MKVISYMNCNPITISIRRKTPVPTRRQISHQYRNDWKPIYKIDYSDSIALFKEVGNGPIVTDADFARAIYKDLGPGEYSCIYWKKGKKGFSSLIMLKYDENGFRQVKPGVYKPRKKLNKKQELDMIEMEMKYTNDESKKEILWDQYVKTERAYLSEAGTSLPAPYLRSLQPRYKPHSYRGDLIVEEAEEQETQKETVEDSLGEPEMNSEPFFNVEPEIMEQPKGMDAVW